MTPPYLGRFAIKSPQALILLGKMKKRPPDYGFLIMKLITRRSLVQVQPPQPQNRLISCKIRRFFFAFWSKRFPEKLRDFAKFAVDPNRDPYGAKNVPWRSSSAPRLSCCLGLFFRFQIAAVRTFSMVLAASFWAAVVTWAYVSRVNPAL